VDTTERYAYDAWNAAKAGQIGTADFDIWADLNQTSSLTTRYVHGDAVDQIFARIGTSADQHWLLTDRLGSVRHVVNSTGAAEDTITYGGFGNITSETNPTNRGRYAWTGRELDVETGLQYNRARYYDPATGRWISQDPLGFDAGDSNLYRYIWNKPTSGADPSGLDNLRVANGRAWWVIEKYRYWKDEVVGEVPIGTPRGGGNIYISYGGQRGPFVPESTLREAIQFTKYGETIGSVMTVGRAYSYLGNYSVSQRATAIRLTLAEFIRPGETSALYEEALDESGKGGSDGLPLKEGGFIKRRRLSGDAFASIKFERFENPAAFVLIPIYLSDGNGKGHFKSPFEDECIFGLPRLPKGYIKIPTGQDLFIDVPKDIRFWGDVSVERMQQKANDQYDVDNSLDHKALKWRVVRGFDKINQGKVFAGIALVAGDSAEIFMDVAVLKGAAGLGRSLGTSIIRGGTQLELAAREAASFGRMAHGGASLEAIVQTRTLRQIRTLTEQGKVSVSQETLDLLRGLRHNGSRLEIPAGDLPGTLPRMAELQRAAQVEFALIQQDGRYFLVRGLQEEVAFGRNAELLIAHTHPGPPGFMALRPSLLDRRNLPLGQDASIIIGADGRWLVFSRGSGRPRILAGGRFD
jgi:RHS repeat-associated protein